METYYVCTEPDCDFATTYSNLRRTHEFETGHEVGVRQLGRWHR